MKKENFKSKITVGIGIYLAGYWGITEEKEGKRKIAYLSFITHQSIQEFLLASLSSFELRRNKSCSPLYVLVLCSIVSMTVPTAIICK